MNAHCRDLKARGSLKSKNEKINPTALLIVNLKVTTRNNTLFLARYGLRSRSVEARRRLTNVFTSCPMITPTELLLRFYTSVL